MTVHDEKNTAMPPYEPPAVATIGRVSTLTLTLKQFGTSDGITFLGTPIGNVSA